MDITQESCRKFTSVLASSAPAPGGGGAAALVGALGTALGGMVASLTVGKKKYAAVEAEILAVKEKCDCLQQQLLDQVEADEAGFLPLLKAYQIPKTDPDRSRILEEASQTACVAPIRIIELCCESIECIAVVAEKGSRMAVSDAGCAAAVCKAALQAAALSVFVNTNAMTDRNIAEEHNRRTTLMLNKYCRMADDIFETVLKNFT